MKVAPKDRRALVNEVLLALAGLAFVLPIALVFVTSFKSESEIVQFRSLLPDPWTPQNYMQLMSQSEEVPIARWFFNSVLVSTSVTALVLAVCSMAAYALARLSLPGGRILFTLILATMMVPGQILLVPMYLILNALGWLDTYAALIVPAGASAFGVFLLHQFFKGIPKELEEAAAIDGCSKLGIYFRIILPLSMPVLATLGIFTFIGSWNDFVSPLIYMDSSDHFTLPVGIALFQTSYYNDYGLTLAASAICTVPVLVIFLLFQRWIVQGMATAGMKE